jgi:phage virion morphogenesis protein
VLKISVTGTGKVELEKLAGKTKTLPKAIAKATVFLERQTKVRFASQTDPDGKSWAGLAPSTLARKKTSAILRETSTLVNSISSSSAGLIGQVSASTEYGIYHQSGTSKMPQRKFIGINEGEDVPKINEIIRQHLGL